jgi:hypothetical protein
MKKLLIITIGLFVIIPAFAQEAACDCPSCLAAASGEKLPYTLPGLQELNEETAKDAAVKVDDHDDHAGHDHEAEEGAEG